MLQLTQNLKTGKMELLEVPFPALSRGNVLIRNHYSIISSGTEGKSVKTARAGYIAKAKEKPKEVKRVLDSIKSKGLMSTYKIVMNRLDMPSPLGYSCVGEVIEVGGDITDFKVGDLIACGGGRAFHAEVVSIPKNLCVRVPQKVDMNFAAFTTIGAIALQGIRQADLRMGENCVIIGLGLIGQLAVQLLYAGGINAIGIDIERSKVDIGKQSGAKLALERSHPNLEQHIIDFTDGFGADAVIITAATKSLDPVELAGVLCRKKGKVVIVGDVPTGFSRENYYKKELELRMSCSYGPGRYDAPYEEKGIDYPIGYVRWTEKRNMQSFLEFLGDKKVDVAKLITHSFEFNKAPQAYQMILDKTESFFGILLKYDTGREIKKYVEFPKNKNYLQSKVAIGFIGAGSFAQNNLLPVVQKYGDLIGVADAKANIARKIADKYRFQYCTGNADEIISDDKISTVFIATRHNLHAEFILKALKNNKNVFVEKPLCMNLEELEEIKKEYEKRRVHLMLGFNRRFSPHIQKLKGLFLDIESKAINYRINVGMLPSDHWIHDKEIGGGRIIGEVCHFVDLAMFIASSSITNVSALPTEDPRGLGDTLIINLGFENGSIASISYFSNGHKRLNKEYLEVFSGGQVAVIDDFKKMTIYSKNISKIKLSKQDKGHSEEVRNFINSIKEGLPTPIPFEEIYLSTLATFKILESIRNKKTIIL